MRRYKLNKRENKVASLIEKQYENWDERFDSFELNITKMFKELKRETSDIEGKLNANAAHTVTDKKVESDTKSKGISTGTGGNSGPGSNRFIRLVEIGVALVFGAVVATVWLKTKAFDKVM